MLARCHGALDYRREREISILTDMPLQWRHWCMHTALLFHRHNPALPADPRLSLSFPPARSLPASLASHSSLALLVGAHSKATIYIPSMLISCLPFSQSWDRTSSSTWWVALLCPAPPFGSFSCSTSSSQLLCFYEWKIMGDATIVTFLATGTSPTHNSAPHFTERQRIQGRRFQQNSLKGRSFPRE